MEEILEQFANYFRNSGVNIYDVSEQNGKVKVTIDLSGLTAEVSFDRYMVSIVHYIAPIRETSDMLYYKIDNLDNKFKSIANIGLNCGNYNGKKYQYCTFAEFGNNDPYKDADNFFDKYTNVYNKIKYDLTDLLNYV